MNLIKSTGTFSFYTILSRILGYVRDLLIALNLGSGPITDAFFVAFRIPNTFRRLFSEGTFNAAFVPSYSSELIKSKKKAEKFSNRILNFLIISLLAITLVIEILMPIFIYVIAPGFAENNDKLDLTIKLTRITFPFLFFISITSFFSAILNSHNKFGVAAFAPTVLNLILIFILFFLNNENDNLVTYLAYGVSIAGLLQFIILYFFVKKFFSPKINFNFNLKIDKMIKSFFYKLIPSIFSSGVTQINILVGTIIASFQANAVSYLYYADRIYQINLAIAGIAIGIVLLPSLSKYIQSKNKKKINFIQNKSVELSLFLSLPAMFALIIASEQITSSLFGYGSFDELSVKNSAKALYYFAFGLPAFALIKIFSSFLFARQNTKIPFYFSLISVTINILISISFFDKVGFIIIPISTTISSWINAILLFVYLKNRNYYYLGLNFIFALLKIFCSVTFSSYFFYFMINKYSNVLIFNNNYKLLFMMILIIITLLLYFLISIFTKAFKLSDIKLKY